MAAKFCGDNLQRAAGKVTGDPETPALIAWSLQNFEGKEETWQEVELGNPGDAIAAIEWPEAGRLYVTTTAGEVYLSDDWGESYTLVEVRSA